MSITGLALCKHVVGTGAIKKSMGFPGLWHKDGSM